MTCSTSIRSSGSTGPISIVGAGVETDEIFVANSMYFDEHTVEIQVWRVPINGSVIGPEETLFIDYATTDGFAPGGSTGLGVGPDGDIYMMIISSFDSTNTVFRFTQDGDIVDSATFAPYSFQHTALTFNGIANRLLVCQRPGAWEEDPTGLEIRIMNSGLTTLHTISLDTTSLMGFQFITTDDGRSWLPIMDLDGFGFIVIDPLSGDYDVYRDNGAISPTLVAYELDCTGLGVDYQLEES